MLKITVKGKSPVWGERCMIADNATLAGDITMGNDCSIWFGAVLRADVDKIVMGDRCNVQDLACIHQTAGGAAVLGNDVSLGHGAVVHAATIHDGALIPARFIKKTALGQAEEYAKNYLTIKEWY